MRRTLIVTAIAVTLPVLLAWVVLLLNGEFELTRRLTPVFYGSAILAAIVFLAVLQSYVQEQLDVELKPIREEREKLQQQIGGESRFNVLHTIQLSLNQLNEYYTINKVQARRSFNFSVSAVFVGLLTLVSGIWMFYLSASKNVQLATLSAISGIFIQFIGGANFYIYNKSLGQLNIFYRELINTQNTMLAIELAEQVSEPKRDAVKERVINHILSSPAAREEEKTEQKKPNRLRPGRSVKKEAAAAQSA